MRDSGTLYVAAVDAELGDLRARGREAVALGVGMLAAGVRMAELLAERRGRLPVRVVLLGTAGAYPDADGAPLHPLGGVVTATRVGLASASAATGRGYVPLPPDAVECVPVEGVAPAVVACCTAITTDPAAARALGAIAGVEHMELFGVAHACARVGVPVMAVLGVTNLVGPEAHAQWKAHRAQAEAAARAAVG